MLDGSNKGADLFGFLDVPFATESDYCGTIVERSENRTKTPMAIGLPVRFNPGCRCGTCAIGDAFTDKSGISAARRYIVYDHRWRSGMPKSLFSAARTALFGIAPEEACLDKRGFAATTPDKQKCLEDAGKSFIHGYLIALSCAEVNRTATECEKLEPALHGFAFEGSAMGLALIDLVSVGKPRLFRAFAEGPAQHHIYMVHVGAGWALARCPWGMLTFFPFLDPLLRWLAIDGLGFHEGFFHPSKFIATCGTSRKRRKNPEAFDNGLGRAMWFASGARAEFATQTVAAFPKERQAALWSGIGLAATYAGGASSTELQNLLSAAGKHRDELALGAAFAAKARCRAGNLTDNANSACGVFCQMDARSAAAVTDERLAALGPLRHDDSYVQWRESIRREFLSRWATMRTP